jgi:methylmalonyl-CoA mutase
LAKEHGIDNQWLTAEQIAVKPVYGKDDLAGMEHLNYAAGLPPYLRGPYSTMYVNKPWTIRQYAGFSTAEESNAFYRRNLAAGQKGLSIALTWQRTEATIRIMKELLEMLVKQVWLSILFWI